MRPICEQVFPYLLPWARWSGGVGVDRGRQIQMELCWAWSSRGHLSPASPLVPQGPGTPSIVLFDFCSPRVEAPDLSPPMGIKICVRSRVLPHPSHPQAHTLTAPILYIQEPLLLDPKITHFLIRSCDLSSWSVYEKMPPNVEKVMSTPSVTYGDGTCK